MGSTSRAALPLILFLAANMVLSCAMPRSSGARAAEPVSRQAARAGALPEPLSRPEAAVASRIHESMLRLQASGGLYLRGLAIASGDLLPRFYAARAYAPVWTDPARVGELLALLATAEAHGLNPADYYLAQLRALHDDYRVSGRAGDGAALDILLTESLVRFGYHQRFGKVNPQRLEASWNLHREFRPGRDPLSTLQAAVAAPSLREYLDTWLQRAPLYQALQAQLAIHREIARAGGWPGVPPGPALKPGMRDARVAALRERLAVSGDVPAPAASAGSDGLTYDEDLAAGVRRFQARHALEPDGVAGRKTLEALNVPVATRIDQLRLSLERARWVLEETDGDFVVVNIAGFQVSAAEDGEAFWWRRAVVGRVVRQTPIFKGLMTYIELNPTWTIPPTILREDVLPRVRADPGYLRTNHITVLDREGRRVDPDSIDWQALGSRVPYTLRQEPGPDNSLGRIKFMFPNRHAVFLHDTPRRDLFDRAQRLFSSGCIRVDDPLSLAEIVLGEPGTWNRETLQAAIATGETRRISLPRPWPVLVLYWTADLDGEGRVRFLPDVYSRDPPLLRALNGDVVIEFPEPAASASPR